MKLNKEGIYYNKEDEIYDIVLNIPELTVEIVRGLIKKLSKITGVKYQLGKSNKKYISVDI